MNRSHCLKVAEKMNALLEIELGEGIDTRRMLDDALYARDVLLVCEALRGTGLRHLARLFREESDETAALHRAGDSMGLSEFVDWHAGQPSELPARRPAPAAVIARKSWRWLPRVGAAHK